MEIYTIQHPAVLEEISNKGYSRPIAELCMDSTDPYYGYRIAYRWMIDELEKKCGLPLKVEKDLYESLRRRDDELFRIGWKMETREDMYPALCMPPSPMPHPVWGWQKMQGRADGKPDMRAWTTDEPEQVVRLRLDIPQSRLLFTDFDSWHIPLNMGYFPSAVDMDEWEAQDEAFDEKCRKASLCDARELFSEKINHIVPLEENPVIHALQCEFLASWKNCIVEACNLGSPENPVAFRDNEWKARETQCVFWEIRSSDIMGVEHFTTRKAGKI